MLSFTEAQLAAWYAMLFWPLVRVLALISTAPLLSLFGLAGVLELVGGVLLLIGLWTRPVAFVLSGEMAVAYFKAHAVKGFWPLLNTGELAVLYCFLWLFFAAAGPGAFSVDGGR